jgi:hypothetical protein
MNPWTSDKPVQLGRGLRPHQRAGGVVGAVTTTTTRVEGRKTVFRRSMSRFQPSSWVVHPGRHLASPSDYGHLMERLVAGPMGHDMVARTEHGVHEVENCLFGPAVHQDLPGSESPHTWRRWPGRRDRAPGASV